ncbi:ComEC/Rec2 family competence protein [Kitasatospora sp. NPDC050543]|uniref:ComEC/Rec2 family competence protein n=1 Tax=Kitasatospora sp. NPDC050543 TaxID=3364054 RepID=UPI0037903457
MPVQAVPPDPTTSPRPADLRLLLPTASAWAVTAVVLSLDPSHSAASAGAAVGAVALAGYLLARSGGRTFRAQHRHGPSSRRAASVTLAVVLLTAAAATATTLLHTADLHRGPLPALAAPPEDPPAPRPGEPPARAPAAPPDLLVELTIAGDPEPRTSRSRGTAPGQSLVTVDAIADKVTTRAGAEPPATTRTRTPVTVMVRAEDAQRWQVLLPSTRIAADVRVLPAGEGHDDTAALLLAHGPPRVLAQPGLVQRIAGGLRAGLRSACDHLPADARGLLPGLVVGDTSRLPDDLRDAFRATDLVHLTAVSGANLSIVLFVLLGAPGRAGTPERLGLAALLGLSLRSTAVLGTAVVLGFVTICRPEPSVLRAAATGLIGLLALGTGRSRQAVPALSGAVLLLVLLDPFLAHSYGFLLSVLATAGLLTLSPRWAAALRERGWPRHLAAGFAAAAAAQVLCAPVTVLLAPRVSLVAVPCNLLAELAVTPATLLGFAALAVHPLSAAAAGFLADLAAVPAGWLAVVARHGAAMPGAQLSWPGGLPGAVVLALATLAAYWAAPLLLPAPTAPDAAAREPRTRRVAGAPARAVLAGVFALVLLALLLRPPVLTRITTGWPPAGWRLAVCDIGQGDMLVLPIVPESEPEAAPDSAVVIDTGPDPRTADACLRDLGITSVPLLLVTHFHADHVEGVPGVLRGREVGAIEGSTLDEPPGEAARVRGWAAAAGVPLLRAARGEHRTAGPSLSWEVLWPDDQQPARAIAQPGPGAPPDARSSSPYGAAAPGANNASVALLATVGRADRPGGGLRIALLGDLEPSAQAVLLNRLRPGRVDVLKVAHHGSANQDWDLAAALRPRLALISCGRDNPYGHPSPRTVDRLRALGATVLRTDQAGDIAVLGDSPAALRAATHPPDRPEAR